ncbi:8122_t:CDS:2 [Paraglomus occultum]|uniref:8122_t:CDS:1 n=1 Tax=Paraglomus occultum TaxID=144539 RepID=A0A9N9AIV3_9GLOM|nr:8122_t:CDS:2 [Paraglomus occultum]
MSNAVQSNTAVGSRRSRVVILPPVSLLSNVSAEPFVDTHTHLHYVLEKISDSLGLTSFEALKEHHFPKNLEYVINVLCEVENFYPDIYPGTFRDWRVMAATPYVYLTAGVHPHSARLYDDQIEAQMVEVLLHEKTVALGEIGLDYHYDNSPRDVQRQVFIRQIKKAIDFKKPLVIHTREAEQDTWDIMREHVPKEWKVHVHCFTDSPEFATKLLEYFPNLFLGITGVVTYSSAKNTQQIVRSVVPLNRFLLETDAPYMIPAKLNRNRRTHEKITVSHSGMIPLVAEKIAQLRGINVDDVMKAARENAREMYGI